MAFDAPFQHLTSFRFHLYGVGFKIWKIDDSLFLGIKNMNYPHLNQRLQMEYPRFAEA
jgi:hypothetical protein